MPSKSILYNAEFWALSKSANLLQEWDLNYRENCRFRGQKGLLLLDGLQFPQFHHEARGAATPNSPSRGNFLSSIRWHPKTMQKKCATGWKLENTSKFPIFALFLPVFTQFEHEARGAATPNSPNKRNFLSSIWWHQKTMKKKCATRWESRKKRKHDGLLKSRAFHVVILELRNTRPNKREKVSSKYTTYIRDGWIYLGCTASVTKILFRIFQLPLRSKTTENE